MYDDYAVEVPKLLNHLISALNLPKELLNNKPISIVREIAAAAKTFFANDKYCSYNQL